MSLVVVVAKDHAATSASGVRFMSMSMSKGLTVEASIVIGAEEGIVPTTGAWALVPYRRA